MRYAVGVEYDGAAFHGWQFQDGVRTVQQLVEAAFSRVADHAVTVVTAGRTDTGVHATGQVIHFDSQSPRTDYSWVRGANSNLPDDVSVLWVKPVADDFHARFSALERTYHYVIYSRPVRSACLARKVTWEYRPLSLQPMQQATQYLVGEHNFSSFRAAGCQAKSPVRQIYSLDIVQRDAFFIIRVQANAFLQHMVRNIAGVLMTIGAGEAEPRWAQEVLNAQDRTHGGVTAAPDGLYLTGIRYPEQFVLPTPEPWWFFPDL